MSREFCVVIFLRAFSLPSEVKKRRSQKKKYTRKLHGFFLEINKQEIYQDTYCQCIEN